MDGGGRKASLPDLEEELLAWIDALRATNLRVTRSSVLRKAIELAQSRGNEESFASRGWMERFFKRNSLSLRRRTTVSQRLPTAVHFPLFGILALTVSTEYTIDHSAQTWKCVSSRRERWSPQSELTFPLVIAPVCNALGRISAGPPNVMRPPACTK